MTMSQPGAPLPATPVAQDKPVSRRLARLTELEQLLSPAQGLERVENYAKWVFGGTAAVAALGALYTKQIVGDLNVWGRLAAALGLVTLAYAMACAARALAPVLIKYTPGSIDTMEAALGFQFMRRRPWLERAGWGLAAALVLYGLAPLVGVATGAVARTPATMHPVNRTALDYKLTPRPQVEAKLDVAGAAPFRGLELSLTTDSATLITQAAEITDSTGKGSVSLSSDSLSAGTYTFVARYTPRGRDTTTHDTAIVLARREIRIPLRSAPRPGAQPAAPRGGARPR